MRGVSDGSRSSGGVPSSDVSRGRRTGERPAVCPYHRRPLVCVACHMGRVGVVYMVRLFFQAAKNAIPRGLVVAWAVPSQT